MKRLYLAILNGSKTSFSLSIQYRKAKTYRPAPLRDEAKKSLRVPQRRRAYSYCSIPLGKEAKRSSRIAQWNRASQLKNGLPIIALAEAGMSTLELLIAFGVGVIALTAATVVAFGNQTVALDTQLNHEALEKAGTELKNIRIIAQNNFNSISSTTPALDGIYSTSTQVQDLTICRKRVTSKVTWTTESMRSQKVELTTDLTDIPGFFNLGKDCDISSFSASWTKPETLNSAALLPIGVGAISIDVLNQTAFLGASSASVNDPDLYIFNTSGVNVTTPPNLLASRDFGLSVSAVDVASTSLGAYAFIANDSKFGQLQVIDVSNLNNPMRIASASTTFTTLTPGLVCPGTNCPGGRSIYYYNQRVYMGTQYLSSFNPAENHEFYVFDVFDPTHPTPLGSFNLNNNINSIVVRGNYAYLATSADDSEVKILDISNLSNITEISSVDASGNADGKSLFLIGNKLYLGRRATTSARPDFLVIDVTKPTTPSILGSIYLDAKDINGIRVHESLAFIAENNTAHGLQILNISNPSNITIVNPSGGFSDGANGIDYEDRNATSTIYTSNNGTSGAPGLRIFYDKP